MEDMQGKYTPKQVEEKIDLLMTRVKGNKTKKELVRTALNFLSARSGSIGEDIVMRMPDNVRFFFETEQEMESQEAWLPRNLKVA